MGLFLAMRGGALAGAPRLVTGSSAKAANIRAVVFHAMRDLTRSYRTIVRLTRESVYGGRGTSKGGERSIAAANGGPSERQALLADCAAVPSDVTTRLATGGESPVCGPSL